MRPLLNALYFYYFTVLLTSRNKFEQLHNVKLHAYCVIEVKTGTFGAGDIGQLGTYMTAVNHILKTEQDNPTIGLLICKDKDNVLAQYALESSSQPIGVAEFQLTKFIPDEFKSSLPSIEDIELELK